MAFPQPPAAATSCTRLLIAIAVGAVIIRGGDAQGVGQTRETAAGREEQRQKLVA